jgi:uncharacterized damage-inducible protein DinB
MNNDAYFPTIRLLAEYEVWCNAKAFDAAAALPPAQLRQRFPFGLGTIHETLCHTVEVMRHWGGRVGPELVDLPWRDYDPQKPLADVAQLSAEVSATFLVSIDASHAAGVLHRDRRIVQVFHLVTHGTHHRTQFITMLRLLGIDSPFEAGDFGGWQRTRPT